jgi:hypothetical protein
MPHGNHQRFSIGIPFGAASVQLRSMCHELIWSFAAD